MVLVPLFKSFGYLKVEFHGGPSERGKDLICWRHDELGEIELTVAQTKRYKPTPRARDKRSFSEIVTQLSQCLETPVPYTDGNTYLPSAIFLVTPFEIDTLTLSTRFEKVAALKQWKVKILDGTKLVRIAQERISKVVSSLLGGADAITKVITPQLSNHILMGALGFQATRHIKDFYTDIDIAVGHVQARYLLASQFKPMSRQFEISLHQWKTLKTTLMSVQTEFNVPIIRETPEEVDARFAEMKAKWESWKEENRRINARADELSNQFTAVKNSINTAIKILVSSKNIEEKKESKEIALQIKSDLGEIEDRKETALQKRDPRYTKEISRLLELYLQLHDDVPVARRLAEAHKHSEPTVKVCVNGEGYNLAEKLVAVRNRISFDSANLNAKPPMASELRAFIEDCHRILSVIAFILQDDVVANLVGLSPTDGPMPEFARLSIPVDTVFASGMNVAVFGEAGAGKTTALQMYAYRHYELPKLDQLVVFAPLAHLVRLITLRTNSSPNDHAYSLDEALVAYLISLGAAYSLQDFKESAQKGGIILLDSIDEAYTDAPWIIESLENFSKQYPKLQLITSSRVSGEYSERIQFVGIRLMPFTDEQQISFISSWFGADGKDHVAVLLKHLEQHTEVADVVRNPLLATAMCALQEHSVPLPTNEIRLYEEWLSLLVGVYDIHKKIIRTKSARHNLELLAEKIAFRMHVQGQREASRAKLIRFAIELFDRIMEPADAQRVLEELVHPCNVLVPTGWSDRLGFGHLRYQEFLTARELRHNRGIRIAQFVDSSWWKGVLILFAQMHESMDWLIEEISAHPLSPVAEENLLAMIHAGPQKGRKDFQEFVTSKAKFDGQIQDDLLFLKMRALDPTISFYEKYSE